MCVTARGKKKRKRKRKKKEKENKEKKEKKEKKRKGNCLVDIWLVSVRNIIQSTINFDKNIARAQVYQQN